MIWYAFPSAFSLAVKLCLLLVARKSFLTDNRIMGAVILSLGVCNAIELYGFGFTETQSSLIALNFLKLYYVAMTVAGFSLLRLAILYCNWKPANRIEWLALIILFLLLLPFIGDHYIAGYESIDYALTRIPGPYYWVPQVLIFLPMLLAISLFGFGAVKLKSDRCRLLLKSMSPIFAVLVFLLFAMNAGLPISASVLFSCATSYFAVSIYYTESAANRAKIRLLVPGTKENRQARLLIKALIVDPIPLMEAKRLARRVAIESAIEANSGNKSAAARQLQVSDRSVRAENLD